MKGIVSALLSIILTGHLLGGEIEPGFKRKLDKLQDNDIIQIIVELNQQADFTRVRGNRTEVIVLLQNVANATQSKIISFLENEQRANKVITFKSYYIFNGLFVECTKEAVLRLADFEEIKTIFENKTISITGSSANYRSSLMFNSSSGYWWNITKIGAKKVREQLGVDGTGVLIGIIDEGFSSNHPDLVPRWKSQFGWRDFVNGQPNPYDSNNGHGTQVTGILVAGNSSGDEIGIAPGAQFISAKAFHDHSGYTNDILDAMEWMLDPDDDGNPNTGNEHVPDVVNNSWGGSPYDTVFRNSVDSWIAAGIFPCFIAQNWGPNPSTVSAPGSYPQSFCVGAVDDNDVIQNFSGRGPVTWSGVTYIKPDVVAPSGPNIKFCIPTDQTWWQQNYPNGYLIGSGATSTAGPHVTGAVALILSAHPNWDIDQIKQALESSAVDLGASGRDNDYGSGRIDVFEAIAPQPPQNLQIPNAGQNGQNPILAWDANSEPNLNHYQIYRGYNDLETGQIIWNAVATTTNTSWTDYDVTINSSSQTRFYYKITAVDDDNIESDFSNMVNTKGYWVPKTTADPETLPQEIALHQNYPNPFNSNTEIHFDLPADAHVVLKIYNILGEEARTLVDNHIEAGLHSITWDGKDETGEDLPSGVYVYRFSVKSRNMSGKSFLAIKKLTLLR